MAGTKRVGGSDPTAVAGPVAPPDRPPDDVQAGGEPTPAATGPVDSYVPPAADDRMMEVVRAIHAVLLSYAVHEAVLLSYAVHELGLLADDPLVLNAIRPVSEELAGDPRFPTMSTEFRSQMARLLLRRHLGAERVEMALALGRDEGIGRRIAAYTVFHLNPAHRGEAIARARELAESRGKMARVLRNGGIRDDVLAREFAEDALLRVLHENEGKFDWRMAGRTLIAVIRAKRDDLNSLPDARRSLDGVLRYLAAGRRTKGPKGSGGAASPAGGADPAPSPAGGQAGSARGMGAAPPRFGSLVVVEEGPPARPAADVDDDVSGGQRALDSAATLVGVDALPPPAVVPAQPSGALAH